MSTETRICDCCGDLVNDPAEYLEVMDGHLVVYLVGRCMEPFLKVVLEQPTGTNLNTLIELTRQRVGS